MKRGCRFTSDAMNVRVCVVVRNVDIDVRVGIDATASEVRFRRICHCCEVRWLHLGAVLRVRHRALQGVQCDLALGVVVSKAQVGRDGNHADVQVRRRRYLDVRLDRVARVVVTGQLHLGHAPILEGCRLGELHAAACCHGVLEVVVETLHLCHEIVVLHLDDLQLLSERHLRECRLLLEENSEMLDTLYCIHVAYYKWFILLLCIIENVFTKNHKIFIFQTYFNQIYTN